MTLDLQSHVNEQLERLTGFAPAVALGFSGGGDSHALLLLARNWAQANQRKLLAFIVDHGLRSESASEAQQAKHTAEAAGVEAEILTWRGDKPTTGIQAKARLARHTLLAQALERHGIRHLLLAHTMDDQAETIWMRLGAGSGWRGCAGMQALSVSPIWPEGRHVSLVRPLLHRHRCELRDYLRQAQANWIDDPSNEDDRFTRIRARRRLSELSQQGFDSGRLVAWSDALQEIDRAEQHSAARLALACLKFERWGGARIAPTVYCATSQAVRLRMLDAAVAAVSGQADTARAGLKAIDEALRLGKRVTGQGVMTETWHGQAWLIRDPGDVTGRADRPLKPPKRQVDILDGRFRVEVPEGVTIGPLGAEYSALNPAAQETALKTVPGRARRSLLAFRRGKHILALAGLTDHRDIRCHPLLVERFMHRTFAGKVPAWFDANAISARPEAN